MSDPLDPREQLKNSLRELQDLRREKHERPALIAATAVAPSPMPITPTEAASTPFFFIR